MKRLGKKLLKKGVKKLLFSLSIGTTLIITILLFVTLVLVGAMMDDDHQTFNDTDIEISELGEKEIPAKYIPIYKKAGKEYGIAWTLIAAFHKVETNFSTSSSMVSSAGAIGHFQFLPETWLGWSYGANPPKTVYTDPKKIAQYGGYGVDANKDGKADPYDIEDAAFSCANYVKANGGMEKLRDAIYAYNHAVWYVERVMNYYQMYSKGDYKPAGSGSPNGQGKGGYFLPIRKPIVLTSGYGYRNNPTGVGASNQFHNGFDMVNDDRIVMAAKSGKVVYAQFDSGGYGNVVSIQHDDGYYTIYGHLAMIKTNVGKQVKAGEQIGVMGTTGNSTGVHLHFSVTRKLFSDYVDPTNFLPSLQ